MKFTFNTPINKFLISKKTKNFFDESIIKEIKNKDIYSYGFNHIKEWDQFVQDTKNKDLKSIYDFLSSLYPDENPAINKNIFDLLTLLKIDGYDLTELLENSLEKNKTLDDKDYDNRFYLTAHHFKLYCAYLHSRGETLKPQIFEELTSDIINTSHQSYYGINENIVLTLYVLRVAPPKSVTPDLVYQMMEQSCMRESRHSRENTLALSEVNYQSQIMIKDYISKHFPQQSYRFSIFYPDLNHINSFSMEKVHQGIISINVPQTFYTNKIRNNPDLDNTKANEFKDPNKLFLIIKHCCNIIKSDEFLNLIHEKINIKELNADYQLNNIFIKFSSYEYEDLDKFQNILRKTLSGIYPIFESVKISESDDDYDGYNTNTIYTNLKIDTLVKAYTSEHLKESLDVKSSPKQKNKL